MDIELKFITSSTSSSSDKGGVVPPWYNNESDFSKWYSSPNPFDFLYYFNMRKEEDANTMYIQYGQNKSGWGSGRFFIQELEILSQNLNDNKSITVKIRSRLRSFKQRKTQTAVVGYDVNYKLKIFGKEVFSYDGNALDTINQGASPWEEKTFVVQPQQTEDSSGLEFIVRYPNGEETGSDVFMGFGLYNPNPLTYVPMAIRKGSTWRDLDSNKGFIRIRKGGFWLNIGEEDATTSKQIDKGHNRIRKSNNWRQLPKMNGGNAT